MLNMADPISLSVADPYVRGDSVSHCVADPQMKEMRRVARTTTGSKQTMPTKVLRHIQFSNSWNTYT